MVNGVGLFRYVADADLEAYDKGELDSINWNNPIIIYDEYGFIVYDPSMDEEMEEETQVEEEDPDDLKPEGSDGDLEEDDG